MASMTKRERVMRTMRFQETDRVPLYDILQNDGIIERMSGAKLSPGNGPRLTGLAVGRCLDMTRMAGGPNEAPAEVDAGNGLVYRQERWTSWISRRPWSDMAGLVSWIKEDIKRAEQAACGADHRAAFHAHVRESQARFAAGDPDGDPAVLIVESLPGLTHMYSAPGQEMFAYLLADTPGLVEEWLEALTQAELRRVACIADAELIPLVLTADDIAYKTGTMFSPAWLRRVFMPRLKRLNDAWHERGALCIFHSDGNLWGVLDDLVATGIDGLNPLEILAGMDPGPLRRKYPNLVLTGGIDVSDLLVFGTPDQVRDACRAAIRDTGGVGYFMGSSTELHWDVKVQNALAMFGVGCEPFGARLVAPGGSD
jgi:hypothetical protein